MTAAARMKFAKGPANTVAARAQTGAGQTPRLAQGQAPCEGHRRSVTQETIRLIEIALEAEEKAPSAPGTSYWATRKLIPEFEAALNAGAFSGGTDSTQIISEERDAR